MGVGRTVVVSGIVGLVAAGAAFGVSSSWTGDPPTVAMSPAADTRAAPLEVPATSVGPDAGIARVIDGDTFELTDGHRVRVLGIDSCEMSTPGGALAARDAEALLSTGSVTLTSEPGVDSDRYGRLLRYVTLAGGVGFGDVMATRSHTGVFEGTNDASPAHLARLRAADADGRDCSRGLPTVYVPELPRYEWPDVEWPEYEWPDHEVPDLPDLPRYEWPEPSEIDIPEPTEPAPLPDPEPLPAPQPIDPPELPDLGGGES